MTNDIVTRLRARIHNDRSVEMMNCEAADEIERLRKERDEARQIACAYCVGFQINEVTVDLAKVVLEANRRGWDCFKSRSGER